MRFPSLHRRALAASAFLALGLAPALHAQGTLALWLDDYAAAPVTGFDNGSANSAYVARLNFLREEPGASLNRFFVCDLNGKLYILDKTTKAFATYLDFNRNTTETPGVTGLFPAFTRAAGYANGLVTFQFDPGYRDLGSANYGKFYTVHIETDTNDGAAARLPNASAFPGFANAATYTATSVNEAPGTDTSGTRQAVLIEWQDSDPTNTTFEGTAREVLRIEFNGRIHPMGDLLFNPLATNSAHPDWRKLYLAVGDGGAGEQNNATLHATPQRLDVLQGKILRISPDAPADGSSLRYTIPADNPFVGSARSPAPRPEIYAYGFRNCHRLAFDATTGLLLEADIGFHTWEEVNIIRPGANYGYADREGTGVLDTVTGFAAGPLPADDATKGYTYPVIQYPHSPALGVGDAIAGGFVYRGTKIPQLQGKFIFGDITTGELFYADLAEMVAADDGNPATLARFHALTFLWDNPRTPTAVLEPFDRLYEIVADTYHARGGPATALPGSAIVSDLTGGGRADIRLAVDQAGELYVLSKSDGMIRAIGGAILPAVAPVISKQPAAQTIAAGGTVAFSVEATGAADYQWKRNGAAITGATNATFTLTPAAATDAGSYAVDVINAAGTTPSAAAALTVSTTADPGHLSNLSILSAAGTGSATLIVGFVLDGATGVSFERPLLLRGVGPSLAQFGVGGLLTDPQLALYRDTTLLASADNWSDSFPGATDGFSAGFGAFPLPPASMDAALRQNALARGAYSVQLTSAVAGQAGSALAEIYDTPGAATGYRQLINVSARTIAGPGANTLIAGFVIGGATARTVLVRAAGPVLSTFHVTGVLADPKLALYHGSEKLADSDNWQSSADLVNTFAVVGAFDFIARSKDAVLYLTLAPGDYTAQVTGATAATGVALVEVYVLP
jgi:hypothetical protein